MARTEARIKTSKWTDDDHFLSLTWNAKGVYGFLCEQPQANLCGVMAFTPASWSRKTRLELPSLNAALAELAQEKFVIIDYDAEEILIRTFMKNDKVLVKPLVIIGMTKQFLTIHSKTLRAAVIDEIPEGFFEGLPERFPKVFGNGSPIPFRNRFPEGFWKGFEDRSRACPPSSILHPPSSIRSLGLDESQDSVEAVENDEATDAAQERRELQGAIFQALGYDPAVLLTATEQTQLNMAAKQLHEVGAAQLDIQLRAKAYRERWPDMTLTAMALVKHWSTLAEVSMHDRADHGLSLIRFTEQWSYLPDDEFEVHARTAITNPNDLEVVLTQRSQMQHNPIDTTLIDLGDVTAMDCTTGGPGDDL